MDGGKSTASTSKWKFDDIESMYYIVGRYDTITFSYLPPTYTHYLRM